MHPALSGSIHAFTHLHRAQLKGVGAPRKPVLFLALMEEIAEGSMPSHRIYNNPELVARYRGTGRRQYPFL